MPSGRDSRCQHIGWIERADFGEMANAPLCDLPTTEILERCYFLCIVFSSSPINPPHSAASPLSADLMPSKILICSLGVIDVWLDLRAWGLFGIELRPIEINLIQSRSSLLRLEV